MFKISTASTTCKYETPEVIIPIFPSPEISLLNEFVDEARVYKEKQYSIKYNPEEIIKFDESDRIIK